MMELTLPLTKEKAKTLKVGDILFLTGFAYTCRDAAHKKIEVALSNGENHQSIFKTKRFTMLAPALPDWFTYWLQRSYNGRAYGPICRNDVSTRGNCVSWQRRSC